jgi:hypothetical protein
MKTMERILITLILIIVGCASMTSASDKEIITPKGSVEDWRIYYFNNEGSIYYYELKSITRPSKDIVKVWEKIEYKGNDLTEIRKEYANASNLLTLFEINCAERKARPLSFVYKSKDGIIVDSIQTPADQMEKIWMVTKPGTMGELLSKAVCEAEVRGADWKKLASYAEGHYYYDTKSIYSSAEGNLRVLSKWVFSEEGKLDNLKKFGIEQENVTHWLIFYEFNCKDKKFSILEISFWREENLSGGTGPMLTEWKSFSRSSPGELLYKVICK